MLCTLFRFFYINLIYDRISFFIFLKPITFWTIQWWNVNIYIYIFFFLPAKDFLYFQMEVDDMHGKIYNCDQRITQLWLLERFCHTGHPNLWWVNLFYCKLKGTYQWNFVSAKFLLQMKFLFYIIVFPFLYSIYWQLMKYFILENLLIGFLFVSTALRLNFQ